MTINEKRIRISSGYVNTNEELEIDQEVTATIRGVVTKTEDSTNNNGTVDRTYVIKGVDIEVKKDE